jgi:hypothetical protein
MIIFFLFILLVVSLIFFVYLPKIMDAHKHYMYKKNQVKINDYHNNDDEDGLPKGVL